MDNLTFNESDVVEMRDTKLHDILGKYNKIWRDRYAGTPHIGPCMDICRELKPKDYREFYEGYIVHPHGRSDGEILELATKYKQACKDPHPLRTFELNIWLHAIVETFDGYARENEVIRYFERLGYTCEMPTVEEDKDYGIDLKIYKYGAHMGNIQCKPVSFFRGKYYSRNPSLFEDRKNAWKKDQVAKEKFGVDTKYMVYNTDNGGWYVNQKGCPCFLLGELCEPNGAVKDISEIIMKI